jgi:type IV secretory pathway TrbD component
MSDLEPRSGSRVSRRDKEQRAYRLVLATGALSAVAVVGLVLAFIDVIGFGLPIVAIVLAVVCAMLFRRTIGR